MREMSGMERILVIDDDQSTLNMLRLLLKALGYSVLTANNGEKGLESFGRELPSIVLTDVKMPGMDGIDVLKQLKRMDSPVEVIMITGHGDMGMAIRCLQHEASDFINKPVQRDALEIALKRAKDKIAMRRQLQDYTHNLEAKVKEATAELSKSCEKLKTLYELSQQVGETLSLSGIIELLKGRIEALTSLSCHALLLLNSSRSSIIRVDHDSAAISVSEDLIALVRGLKELQFLKTDEVRRIFLVPPDLGSLSMALLPIARSGDLPVGAALVGIFPEATENELQLTSTLLSLAAGTIRRAVVHEEELEALRQVAGGRERFGDMVGRHEKMEQVYRLIDSVADSDATVLIQGESGTGKELIARRIHELSRRKNGAFIALSCAAFPQTLLESELFGYEKGAFTGASHMKRGNFELAHGGTLFLDEIGEIPQTAQVKLLRVLQFKEIQRLGGETMIKVDVRILAATSRNLRQEIEQGNFREDLYYRLHVIPIHLPPLRARMSDLPLLVSHFLRRLNERSGKRVVEVKPEVLDILMNYRWPGNIRELENVIEHAFILSRSESIEVSNLPAYLVETEVRPVEVDESLDEVEKKHLVRVLNQCRGNRIQAAKKLKISRSTLYRKLELYGLLD